MSNQNKITASQPDSLVDTLENEGVKSVELLEAELEDSIEIVDENKTIADNTALVLDAKNEDKDDFAISDDKANGEDLDVSESRGDVQTDSDKLGDDNVSVQETVSTKGSEKIGNFIYIYRLIDI